MKNDKNQLTPTFYRASPAIGFESKIQSFDLTQSLHVCACVCVAVRGISSSVRLRFNEVVNSSVCMCVCVFVCERTERNASVCGSTRIIFRV